MSMNKIYDCYKYQVYIYKEALNKIQLHKPKNNYGFILGKIINIKKMVDM